jgi:uncharacterized membrane protein YjgN (DUF898 family)
MRPFLQLAALVVLAPLAGIFIGAASGFELVVWLSVVPIAMAWLAFTAAKRRFLWNHTHLTSATFQCSVAAGGLARLYVVDALLLVATLGIAMPWVKVRNVSFACRHLRLVGEIDLAAITQDAQVTSTMGEGLSTFFDVDAGLG